jgi:hypothetical protein
MSLRAFLACALLSSLSATATSQTVWTVTAANGVQAAINAAAPGDVVDLVGPLFQGFTVDKGVSIRGNGAVVGPSNVTVNVPGGQVAHLDQLSTSTLTVQAGSVRIDRCGIRFLGASQADLLLVATTISPSALGNSAPQAGLQAHNSTVSLRDCTVTGSNAGWYSVGPVAVWYGPSPALTVTSNSGGVQAERCTFVGGAGGTGSGPNGPVSAGPWPAVSLPWSVPGRFADCTLRGGARFGSVPGAPAVGNGAFDFRDTLLISGAPNSTSVTTTNAPLVTMELTPVWTRGTASTLRIEGLPNELHAVFVTPAVAAQIVPVVVEPVYAVGEFMVFAGVNDAAGLAIYQVLVPTVPALQHAPFWCQAVGGVALPFRASVLAGGLVR